MKEGDICPHCEKGKITIIQASEPWTDEHFMCESCDSTYVKEQK